MTIQEAFAAGGGRKANFEDNLLTPSCLQITLVPAQTRCPALNVSCPLPMRLRLGLPSCIRKGLVAVELRESGIVWD
jgi:hypothetical protein